MSVDADVAPDQAAVSGTAGRGWVTIVVAALLVVIVAALLVVNVRLHRDVSRDEARKTAGEAASKVGGKAVEALLSYNYRTIDADLARGLAWTTGSFKRELQTLDAKVVKPTAVSKTVVTKTTVSQVAVSQQSADVVQLLVFAGQVTASLGAQSQQSTSRLKVTMERVGGTWLISALQPI